MTLLRHELRSQMRLYWRSRELAFFTFALPIIMFFLLGSVYGKDRIKAEHNVRGADYLLAGMLGYGAIATGFAGLSIMLVIRRESGSRNSSVSVKAYSRSQWGKKKAA